MPEIQRCPVLANRLRVWGALPLTPIWSPCTCLDWLNRSRGIAVNLQKERLFNYCWILKEWIMRSKCRVRAGEGTREKGDHDSVASADPWPGPHHVYASRRLAPGWLGCSELGQKSWIIVWLMGITLVLTTLYTDTTRNDPFMMQCKDLECSNLLTHHWLASCKHSHVQSQKSDP